MSRFDPTQLEAVLAAAERLLEAHEHEMVTAEEWDGLEMAVAACREQAEPDRAETFSINRTGQLVRQVTPKEGKPYEHRCSVESYEKVAHAVDEAGEAGCTIESLIQATGLPSTRIAVALSFMRERGVVVTDTRWNFPAPGNASPGRVHLDAMTEYYALREKGAD